VNLAVDSVPNWLLWSFGLELRRDGQVLCPMHRGPADAGALNERLQEALTPATPGVPERRYGGRIYRTGDKVTQIRNNYDKGDGGRLQRVSRRRDGAVSGGSGVTRVHGRRGGGRLRL